MRRNLYLFLAALIITLSANLAKAQDLTPIEIDSIKPAVKAQIPFDRAFTLKYYTSQKPASVNYVQLDRGRTWYQTINHHVGHSVLGFHIDPVKFQYMSDRQTLRANARIELKKLPNKADSINRKLATDLLFYKQKYQARAPLRDYPHPIQADTMMKIKYLGIFPTKNQQYTVPEIPSESIQMVDKGKPPYALISFGEVVKSSTDHNISVYNYLKPGKRYAIIITNFDGTTIQIFDAYYKHRPSKAEGDQALQKYLDEQHKQYNLNWNYLGTAQAQQIYTQFLDPEFIKLNAITQQLSPDQTTPNLIKGFSQNDFLKKELQVFTSPVKQIALPGKFIDSLGMLNAFENLIHQSLAADANHSASAQPLIDGQCSLKDTAVVAKVGPDQVKRLNTSLSLAQQLAVYAELLVDKGMLADPSGDADKLRKMADAFQLRINVLNAQNAQTAKINKIIAEKAKLNMPVIIPGSSESFDFKTRAKFQVVPDFGYIAYGFQKGFTSFSPYLGFEVNFRPIDKDIPWSAYHNRTLWHYLSFSTGWTLTSLAKTGKREDFFSSASLMTGIGFKLTNALKWNNGVTWFYQDSPNPILTDRSLRCTFYTGISIDLDLKELMNDFIGQKPNVR